jgi:adenosine deaminase
MTATDPLAASPEARARAQRLPKVLLHEHLDGGLRLATLWDGLVARGLRPPVAAPADLGTWFDQRAQAGSLEAYLEGFGLTVAAMASPAMLRRVTREAVEDAAADGVVLAELRIAPLLFEAHGLDADATLAALCEGLADAPIPAGLIVCAMRHEPPERSLAAARLALRHRGQGSSPGVVGFDLAGAEAGFPPTEHAQAINCCRDADLGITLHAGEADVAERVVEAARLGATRIGHGVRLVDALGDPMRQALVDEAVARGLHLEVCPTSNVHTGAARSIADHPITALWRAGVSLSVHTDNRLMSRVSVNEEWARVLQHTPLVEADLLAMARAAAVASFLPAAARQQAVAAIDRLGPGGDAQAQAG